MLQRLTSAQLTELEALWSIEGDIVYSPFAGIGSEMYVAVRMGRFGIGAELKQSYYDMAKRNLEHAAMSQYDLFA